MQRTGDQQNVQIAFSRGARTEAFLFLVRGIHGGGAEFALHQQFVKALNLPIIVADNRDEVILRLVLLND